jgi:anti-sigma factor RsiW
VTDPRAGHAGHDPLLIAAFLDGDTSPPERAVAETLISTCADCAALHADLLALSSATRDLPDPVRARDFQLTASDAARLATPAFGEPTAATPRLAGVMTDRTTHASHAAHDTMLVASLADHSLATTERSAAEALVATCAECAALRADFTALRDATRAMPTPTRPRDFTLTPYDAVRLRRGGWRRLVAAFGSPRDAFSRPLALGLTTLGLAGLLLASAPSILDLSGSGGPTVLSTVGAPVGLGARNPETATDAGRALAPAPSSVPGFVAPGPIASAAAAAQGASALPAEPAAAASPGSKDAYGPVATAQGSSSSSTDRTSSGGAAASVPAADGTSDVEADQGSTADQPGAPPLLVISGAFLIAGLALFAIRWRARRSGQG